MDIVLEQYEMRLKLENRSDSVLKLIKELRKEIHKFLSYIGAPSKKKNIYNEIHTTCLFFENDLVDMEPKRFQKCYGKLDSVDEEKTIDDFLVGLSSKIHDLEKACERLK
jgi:hypothetical protein